MPKRPEFQFTEAAEALRSAIITGVNSYERSLQTAIGPSQLGTPCTRRLAFDLENAPRINDDGDDEVSWRSAVGTSVHAELRRLIELANKAHARDGDLDRWLLETKVECGTLADGTIVSGTADVYDRLTRELIDWKIVGPTWLKIYAKDGPGPKYQRQVQTYARGFVRRLNLPVDRVGIFFLPMNGEFGQAVYWSEPYRPEISKWVFDRARKVQSFRADGGEIAELPTFDDHCVHCPWFAPGSEATDFQCPGDPSLLANPGDQFRDILPPS